MRILFFGDIVGEPGRKAVSANLEKLVEKYHIDFVIANGENASHGKGLTEKNYLYLLNSGVNCVTLGNHYASKEEIKDYINDADSLVRPLNLVNSFGGVGSRVFSVNGYKIRVTNLMGVAFMKEEYKNPYQSLRELIDEHKGEEAIHIVDLHAEATGEKMSLGYAFDGEVSAFIGTHTHVQTNDARILPKGTGFMSDVGMCGAYNGVLGFDSNSVINKTLFGDTKPFTINEKDDRLINACVLDIDERSGLCREIFPIKVVDVHGK